MDTAKTSSLTHGFIRWHKGVDSTSEVTACLSVQIKSAAGAPFGERLRIDIDPIDNPALIAQAIESCLRAVLPFRKSQGEGVAIHHNAPGFRIVLLAIPLDAGDFQHTTHTLDK